MEDEDRGEYGLTDDVPVAKRSTGKTPVPAQSAEPESPESPRPESIPYAIPGEKKLSVEQLMDQKAPAALILAGIAIELLFACWGLSQKEALWAGMRVGIEIAISAGLMVPVMWYASKARGFALGPAKVAGMKILAISIAPPALLAMLGMVLSFIPLGWAVAWLLSFAFYFALLGVFFDLDQDDTWYCIVLIFIMRVAISVGMMVMT